MTETTRRQFLGSGLAGAAALCCRDLLAAVARPSTFAARGVVLVPEDLTLGDWPERAKRAGLSTIGIHGSSPKAVARWVRSDAGQRFRADCHRRGHRTRIHGIPPLL